MVLERWKKRFIQERFRFTCGYGEFSWIKGTGGFFMLMYLTVKQSGYNIPTWLIVTIGMIVLVCFWIFGYVWDKAHMIHYSAEFNNLRDPFAIQVRDALKIPKRKT
jgi:hypothetical protein